MRLKFLASAMLAALALSGPVRADDLDSQPEATVALTPFVAIDDVTFFRSYEDAFPRAKKEGKLVLFYRMLGDLDGLT